MNPLELHEQIPIETQLPVERLMPAPIPGPGRGRVLVWVSAATAAIYVLVSLYFIVDTRSRLASFTSTQDQAIRKLQARQALTESALNASTTDLVRQLNMTQRQMQAVYAGTTAELRHHQQALETRLQDQEKRASEAIGQVSGQVADVRTQLGGAQKGIVATRTDLESTKVKLDRAIGDLTGQSGLIAHTREDLEELRHRGDRNYYEFTLYKNVRRPIPVSTIGLQLKKADPKKNKFTLIVSADDHTIEKKDRGVAEPLQFYTGRDRLLYEVVIFTVETNNVTGYLSTPKSAVSSIAQ